MIKNTNPTIHVLESVASTQSYIKDIIASNTFIPAEGIACFAYNQTNGVGKLNKKWHFEKGNVAFSFIFPESLTNLSNIGYINLLVAYSIKESLLEILNQQAITTNIQYKWPNDILIDEKKISGILIEIDYSLDNKMYIIVGIGINLKSAPVLSNRPTTDLFSYTKKSIDPLSFTESLYKKINKNINLDFNLIKKDYLTNLHNLNKEVQIIVGKNSFKGVIKEINNKCELILDVKGTPIIITAGEIYNIDN